jgi:hypothetical protein
MKYTGSGSLKNKSYVWLCREKEFCRISIPLPPIDERGLDEILQQSRHSSWVTPGICSLCFTGLIKNLCCPECYILVLAKKFRPARREAPWLEIWEGVREEEKKQATHHRPCDEFWKIENALLPFFSLEKVHFWPSNCSLSLVLAIELQNRTSLTI